MRLVQRSPGAFLSGLPIVGLALWLPARWWHGMLAAFSFGTCLSMGLLSAGVGRVLGGRGARRAAPVCGVLSLALGVWYVLAAVNLV